MYIEYGLWEGVVTAESHQRALECGDASIRNVYTTFVEEARMEYV